MKWGLWKYGLQKGHIRDWDLELLWLVMGYKSGQQVSFAFSSSFLLFIGCEPKMWWSKYVASNMWTSSVVPSCNVNGYGEFGDHSTPI